MLKVIHAQESKKASREKAKTVVAELRAMKLKEAAKKVEDGIEETLTYCDFPSEHWTHIRTNNVIERLNREIRRRTRVVGTFPDAKYQRCTVHFYRNVFSVVPKSKVKIVAKMLKAIHAQESKKASREKAKAVVAELHAMKLKEAAKKVEDGIDETLTYCDFPSEHWTRIRTNNVIERLNREIRRRTRVVGTFPDGNSALMLVCARLRHVAGTQWGNKKYMNMKHLEAALDDASIAG